MHEIKFWPGDKVHARVESLREKFGADGKIILESGIPVKETFVHDEFDGVVDAIAVSRDADGVRVTYRLLHDESEKSGPSNVEERWLTALGG